MSGATAPSLLQDDVTRVRVLLPLPLVGAYDYRVPEELALAPGDFVRVPLGKRSEIGVVWDGAAVLFTAIDDGRHDEGAKSLIVDDVAEALRREGGRTRLGRSGCRATRSISAPCRNGRLMITAMPRSCARGRMRASASRSSTL